MSSFTNCESDVRLYDHEHYPTLTPEYIRDTYGKSSTSKDLKLDADPPPKKLPLWVLRLLPGGISGPVSRTVTAPIDRIRVTIQVNSKVETVFQTIKNLLEDGGILGLWRGNLISVLKVTPEMSLRFAFYERVKQYVRINQEITSVYEKLVSGAVAGVFAQFTVYPLEVLKTRMTIRKTGQYNGAIDAIVKIYKAEGPFAFYRGYCTSAIGIIPYVAIDLTVFETLKNKIVYSENYQQNSKIFILLKIIICATTATSCAQACTYPLYLIKARQQAASRHATNIIKDQWRICKLCQIIYTIIETEGIRGLYRGLFPSLVKLLPASAVNYAVYEYVHQKLIKIYGGP